MFTKYSIHFLTGYKRFDIIKVEGIISFGEVFYMTVYNTILVAVDGSDASKKALQKAVEVANNYEAKLVITHVIDTSAYSPNIVLNTNFDKAEQYAKELLLELKEMAEEAGAKEVETHLDYGSPKAKITKQIAKNYHVDLIVVGATGLNAVERFLIGSVSEHIVRHADVDVLVVRWDK